MKICEKCLVYLSKNLSSVAVPHVGFKLIASVLYLQSVFEIGSKIAFSYFLPLIVLCYYPQNVPVK